MPDLTFTLGEILPVEVTVIPSGGASATSATFSMTQIGGSAVITGATAVISSATSTSATVQFLLNTATYGVGTYTCVFYVYFADGTLELPQLTLSIAPLGLGAISPTSSGSGYFLASYFLGNYFLPNYFLSYPPGGTSVLSPLVPYLYPPFVALFANGRNSAVFSLAGGYILVDAFLVDSPPTRITSLDLTAATAKFNMRNVLSSNLVISNPCFIVSPQTLRTTGIPGTSIKLTTTGVLNECIYMFTPADIAGLIPGKYTGSFVITFPSGLVVEFGGLNIYVKPTDS